MLTRTLLAALLMLGLIALPACTNNSARIDGEHARALVQEGALLLDVRSPGEFRQGHIPNAVNIPVDSLAERLDELPEKQTPIVVYPSEIADLRVAILLEHLLRSPRAHAALAIDHQ